MSITGLKVRSVFAYPIFAYHAFQSMRQARAANGNMSAQACTVDGVHHTLSVWQSKDHMLAYLRSGPHLKAMKVFSKIATGKTFGYATTKIPELEDVHQLWTEHARDVG